MHRWDVNDEEVGDVFCVHCNESHSPLSAYIVFFGFLSGTWRFKQGAFNYDPSWGWRNFHQRRSKHKRDFSIVRVAINFRENPFDPIGFIYRLSIQPPTTIKIMLSSFFFFSFSLFMVECNVHRHLLYIWVRDNGDHCG